MSQRVLLLLAALVCTGCGGETPTADGARSLAAAYAERQSGLWVEAEGTVLRLLPDDRKGRAHQRFVVELPHGQTLLIAHNIDLAPRIEDLRVGDRVRFRGQYEYNDRGGVARIFHQMRERWRRAGVVRRSRGDESVAVATVELTKSLERYLEQRGHALARRARHKDVPSNGKLGGARTSQNRARPTPERNAFRQNWQRRLAYKVDGTQRAVLVKYSG